MISRVLVVAAISPDTDQFISVASNLTIVCALKNDNTDVTGGLYFEFVPTETEHSAARVIGAEHVTALNSRCVVVTRRSCMWRLQHAGVVSVYVLIVNALLSFVMS